MLTFWLVSTIFIALLIGLCVTVNFSRLKDEPVKELVPNCLLTRHPLVFVPGPCSLLYFMKYWNEIPHYLASHGYEVFSLNLPWRNKSHRKQRLEQFLIKDSDKVHLVFDQSSAAEIYELLREKSFDKIASLTWIRTDEDREILANSHQRLSLPVEEIVFNKNSLRPLSLSVQNIFWKLHLLFTGQDLQQSLEIRGHHLQPLFKSQILARTQFLAERDLIQGDYTPRL